jgi:hypothetical protein
MLTSVLCVCVVTNILHEGLHIVSFYLGCCTSNYNLPATLPPGEGIFSAPLGRRAGQCPALTGVSLRNRVGATLAVARNAEDGVPYGFHFDPHRPNP